MTNAVTIVFLVIQFVILVLYTLSSNHNYKSFVIQTYELAELSDYVQSTAFETDLKVVLPQYGKSDNSSPTHSANIRNKFFVDSSMQQASNSSTTPNSENRSASKETNRVANPVNVSQPNPSTVSPTSQPTVLLQQMHYKRHHYDLVLMTTDEGYTPRIQNKSRLFTSLCRVYCNYYNFHPVIFTTTPELIELYSRTCASVIKDFPTNKYNLPIITEMFSAVFQRFDADYYGYVNADILLENNVFEVLHFIKQQVKLGVVKPQHELAGRVYEKDYPSFPYSFTSFSQMETFFKTIPLKRWTLRNVGSADYFIFSKEAMPLVMNTTQQAVIGRREIDNYLLGVMWNGGVNAPVKKDLIDGTTLVHGIHIGRDGFYNRKVKQSPNNERWNFEVRRIHNVHHGFLNEKGNKRIKKNVFGACCIISNVKCSCLFYQTFL